MKKNQEIAEVLYHIAELLELKGENTFKIRAYNKAARAVEGLSTDIEEIYAAEELESIPGVGSAIAGKIGEYLRTGRLGYYDELCKEIPPGLSEMLKIPGLGPKTVQLVYEKVGITDIDALEQAARTHRLRRLPGFGQTKEKNIIKAMENPNVDILAHPSGRLIGERDPYKVNLTAVLEAAERTGTAMEINAHPSRLDLADVYVRKAKELGVRVAIGTDAHSSDGLDMMRFGVMVARRGWLEKDDVINALEADTLPYKQ